MSKAIIQLCIYFCVLGFVVHAQTPDGPPAAEDAYTQMYKLIDDIKVAEAEKERLLTEIAQKKKARENIETQTPNKFKTWLAEKSYSPEQLAAIAQQREKIKQLEDEEWALQKQFDTTNDVWFKWSLTLGDISKNTNVTENGKNFNENRVRAILEANRPAFEARRNKVNPDTRTVNNNPPRPTAK